MKIKEWIKIISYYFNLTEYIKRFNLYLSKFKYLIDLQLNKIFLRNLKNISNALIILVSPKVLFILRANICDKLF